MSSRSASRLNGLGSLPLPLGWSLRTTPAMIRPLSIPSLASPPPRASSCPAVSSANFAISASVNCPTPDCPSKLTPPTANTMSDFLLSAICGLLSPPRGTVSGSRRRGLQHADDGLAYGGAKADWHGVADLFEHLALC